MGEVLALTWAQWRTNLSYRVRMAYTLVGIVVSVVPLFFVAGAVQPVMAGAIAEEGGQAFGFLLVGLTAISLVSAAVRTLPAAVGSAIGNGVLEALLATPTPVGRLLTGLTFYGVAFVFVQALVTLGIGWSLGANLQASGIAGGVGILVLITLAHVPFALMASALVLAFRTPGPLPQVVLLVSTFLGGTYYPTHVVPSWLQTVSIFLPLTYGLRALRGVMLEGLPMSRVVPDLAVLVGSGIALGVVGAVAMRAALRYARRNGTLAQY